MSTYNIVSQLEAHTSPIRNILGTSGCPGLSIGAFHSGSIVHTQHFGCKDIESEPLETPDDDTVYYIASVSKIIAVCALGTLIQEGILGWDVPIREYLSEFRKRNDDLGQKTTLRDLAANITGLSPAVTFGMHMYGERVLPKTEFARLIAHMEPVSPFRSGFMYAAWNYVLIQAITERVTGEDFGTMVDRKILKPLGMKRSTFETPLSTNIMSAHGTLNNGSCHRISINKTNKFDSETGLSAVMGGKSTMREMLLIFSSLLAAYVHQRDNAVDTTPNSPFVQLRTIFSPHVAVPPSDIQAQAYCLGIYRSQLPAVLSRASMNYAFLKTSSLPIFGNSDTHIAGTEVFHHTGNHPGFYASMFLAPASQTGVICLTNATPLVDPTDFAAQMWLATLLSPRPHTVSTHMHMPDFENMAKQVARANIGAFERVARYLESKKSDIRPSLPLEKYEGVYTNTVGNLRYKVSMAEEIDGDGDAEGLLFAPLDTKLTRYELKPWDGDTFYWRADRDEEVVGKAMFPAPFVGVHLVRFAVRDGRVESLMWQHCPASKKPEVLRRRTVMAKLA
ncbi:beta-lactamase/transpeptidase-like protein [Lophiostoma macrostomum CBS 122681]|uniref:Beta-lactamase/transpeptidase-like protein n=1 Tax=Lophiostoma macrostomum CBS 122681 TaxID=1314788 RepID=A0A6A6SMP2_9PLEO|nr:beta-lactamase/transpeptidase-like protein [Lophiostoma macrostomum CBS 122681]